MTAADFIAKLAPVEMERMSLIFDYLSHFTLEARLRNGRRLCDVMDFSLWLEELSEEAKAAQNLQGTEVPNPVERRSCRKVTPQ